MQRRKICRYFQRGKCKKQKCPFVHLHENKKNCQFFMQGFCRKGQNCNFYHPPKQTQEQKQIKQNFKPKGGKKKDYYKPPEQQNKEQEEQYQEQEQEDNNEVEQKKQQKNQENNQQDNNQQKIEEGDKQQEQGQIDMNKQFMDLQKKTRVNKILGLESSSEEQDEEQQTEQKIQQEPKRKPMNFMKIYPKKFPDYSKSVESKERIKHNQQKYFQGKKFLDFLNQIKDPQQKQYYQIIRKYQESFILEFQCPEPEIKQEQPKIYRLSIRPLLFDNQIKLHFQMVQDSIQIQVDSRQYPKQRASFKIMNFSIPIQYRQKLVQSLNKIHQKKNIFETLKTFTNNFQKIYNMAKSKLQDQYFSQIQLQKKIQKKLSQTKKQENPKKKRSKRKQKQENQNPDVIIHKYKPQQKINVGNMNYDVLIQNLMIQNCQYVVVQRILLFIQCRCQKKIIHVLQADRKQMKIGVKLQCKKSLHRQVMQLRSTLVGKLGIQNARILEIGGLSWKIGCQCDLQIIKSKIYLPDQRLNINCHQCFKHMSIHYMGLKFFNPFLTFNITENKQLPNKGACKHMKYSFRWVRYGCCGRCFSCDTCHQKQSIYQHQKIQGITMICGFCSIQQHLNKDCMHCKKELVRGVDKGGHWEGGMGCRDQNLLSKKDAKKYTGMTKKKGG